MIFPPRGTAELSSAPGDAEFQLRQFFVLDVKAAGRSSPSTGMDDIPVLAVQDLDRPNGKTGQGYRKESGRLPAELLNLMLQVSW